MFCRPSCSSVAGFSHGHVVSNENLFQHDQFFFIIFGLIFFKIFQVEFFSFYIVIGCTNTPLFFSISFLSFDYLLILSYVSLLTLCRGWNTTHTFSKIQFKKTMHKKKKIPNRNWKITLRMWMRGGRKVKRKSLISPPPNYSFCTQSPATLFPTIRSTRFCFV